MARNIKRSAPQSSLFPRAVPRMPEGYYSGDQPNPHLRAFVEAHLAAHPDDPATDDYDVPAFDQPIETTKATAIYNMHAYWSKKPHDAIRQYIRHYTQPGDLVLDPFCGSGGTALAALMEGRAAIAIDRSPAATFITKNYCTPIDVDALQEAFEELKAKVKPELDWLYATRCDRCDGPATTGYTVYSQVFQCPRCLSKVPLFDCEEVDFVTRDGKAKKIKACPVCQARGIVEEISTRGQKFGAMPVLVRYECLNGCKPARDERRHNDEDPKKRAYFERYDLGKLHEIDGKDIPYWYPPHKMMNVEDDSRPWGAEWREGRNFRTVADLFTKRNLWALSACFAASEGDDRLRGIVNGSLLSNSRKAQIPEVGGYIPGNYHLPQITTERNVLSTVELIGQKTIKARSLITQAVSAQLLISTQSATEMAGIPAQSIDYIFTDPPYGGSVQYGELNFIWEAWLGFDTHWQDEEIVVNLVRGVTEADWADMMRQAMAECYRALRPGRWLSLCYHDTSEGTWALIQDIMAEAGLVVDKLDSALFIDTGGRTYNQYTADKVTKRDLVINFRKPRLGEAKAEIILTGDEDERTFGEKVREIIREYLAAHPGETRDRVYDLVVSRMVREGQMEAHDFDALLAQVAEQTRDTSGAVRWYLPEAAESGLVDTAESAKEDAAAARLTRYLESSLKRHPLDDGVHYSNLFEWYLGGVQEKPRRLLQDWLPDYFYKTDDGTWRPPANDEEAAAKAHARTNGTSRRIKRYLAFLQQRVAVPAKERPSDATLAEWVRQCRRAGLYEQGTQLYEQGGLRLERLAEEAQVEVEEDYQVCVRMLARAAAAKKTK